MYSTALLNIRYVFNSPMYWSASQKAALVCIYNIVTRAPVFAYLPYQVPALCTGEALLVLEVSLGQ